MPRPLPWEYLGECSDTGLQNFQLSQLNVAASLRKVIEVESEKLIDALVNAEIARLLAENAAEMSRALELRQGVLAFKRRA